MGTLKQLVFRSYSRPGREFTGGIILITESNAYLEYSAYLDVSFFALSEDNFLTVTKKMGDYSRYPYINLPGWGVDQRV